MSAVQIEVVTIAADKLKAMLDREETLIGRCEALQVQNDQLKANQLLNIEQAAQKIGVKPKTLINYEKRGLFPRRVAEMRMYRAGDIDAWFLTDPVNFHRKDK